MLFSELLVFSPPSTSGPIPYVIVPLLELAGVGSVFLTARPSEAIV